ncbi:hypothetical protein C8J57DRAFT_1230439 [Mycena rebaudengoi]|nr:hypothetical protein C8J57DRAFT_1230439 [Mycena rebaudengoi]
MFLEEEWQSLKEQYADGFSGPMETLPDPVAPEKSVGALRNLVDIRLSTRDRIEFVCFQYLRRITDIGQLSSISGGFAAGTKNHLDQRHDARRMRAPAAPISLGPDPHGQAFSGRLSRHRKFSQNAARPPALCRLNDLAPIGFRLSKQPRSIPHMQIPLPLHTPGYWVPRGEIFGCSKTVFFTTPCLQAASAGKIRFKNRLEPELDRTERGIQSCRAGGNELIRLRKVRFGFIAAEILNTAMIYGDNIGLGTWEMGDVSIFGGAVDAEVEDHENNSGTFNNLALEVAFALGDGRPAGKPRLNDLMALLA